MREIFEMKQKLFKDLLASIEEAGRYHRGNKLAKGARVTFCSKLRQIREQAGLSQPQFATLLNVSVRTLQNWEQSRRRPSGPALALIKILEARPAMALEALQSTAK